MEYEVLYYQRSNKVHKSKGVSKFDGILSVALSTGLIQLKNSDFDDSDNDHHSDDDNDDDDDNNNNNYKKKVQKKKNNVTKAIPYKGRDMALAQRCCGESSDQPGLQEDDTIILGGFEVQIVSCLSTKMQQQSQQQQQENSQQSRAPVSKLSTTTTTTHLSSNGRFAVKSKVGGVGRRGGLINRKLMLKPLHSKKNLLAQKEPLQISTNTTINTTNITPTATTTTTTPAVVDAGSKRKAAVPLKSRRNKGGPPPLPPPPMMMSRRGPLVSKTSTHVVGMNTNAAKRPALHGTNTQPVATVTTTTTTNSTMTGNHTTAICPAIDMPASIRTVLRPHQAQGVEFLWRALVTTTTTTSSSCSSSTGTGAILADEMGLGKTLMTIATIMGMQRKDRSKHFVVVCPSSLVGNWAKEFDKWIGKASQPRRVVLQKGDADSISRLKSTYSSTAKMGGQVLILSYELFRRVTSNFHDGIKIGLLVVDEGHRLKNQEGLTVAALESLNCEARLCITATPVQNNLREFYNLASFVKPGLLGDVSVFRRDFEQPIMAANQKNASREQKQKGKEQAKALDALIKPFMLRRLQKDVLKSMLPPRTEVLIFCRPTSEQARLYENLCIDATSQSMSTEALVSLGKLRKLCAHPVLLKSKDNLTKAADVTMSGKLLVLEAMLHSIREENEKVVIVSNYTSVLTLIETSLLRPKQLPFVRLDGSTDQSERQGVVDSFNRPNSSTFAFLLSSKAGGCGLNLIGGNRLIMFDADWNPATDTQAMARIYRPGQTKACYIYRMFTTGTVEEVILQRQIAKESLSVFDGTKTIEKFTKEELKDCFTLKDCDCDTKHKLGTTWLDYNGPDSLSEQKIQDEPLVKVCQRASEVVSFVHLVPEKADKMTERPGLASELVQGDDDSDSSSKSGSSSSSKSDSSDGSANDDESDEEMEFD